MKYYTLEKVYEELDEYYEDLEDKFDDIEIEDPEVKENISFLLKGSYAHLKYIFEHVLFHPYYGNFTRTEKIDMDYVFNMSYISFLIFQYSNISPIEKIDWDEAQKEICKLMNFDFPGSLQFIKQNQEFIERKEKEATEDEPSEGLAQVLSIINIGICGVNFEEHETYQKLSSKDKITTHNAFHKIAIQGLSVFNNALKDD